MNLLPQPEQRRLTSAYYMRLATVFCLMVGTAVALGGVLLMPSYLVSRASADSYERYRAALEGSVGLKERAYTSEDVAELIERIRITESYAKSAFTAELIDGFGDKLTPGIRITAISFTRTDSGASVTLGGTALTRQALLTFADALRASPSFTQVSLPVSQLVTEQDATFSITASFERK